MITPLYFLYAGTSDQSLEFAWSSVDRTREHASSRGLRYEPRTLNPEPWTPDPIRRRFPAKKSPYRIPRFIFSERKYPEGHFMCAKMSLFDNCEVTLYSHSCRRLSTCCQVLIAHIFSLLQELISFSSEMD